MKLTSLDERIHVLDADTSVWKVVRDIAESGVRNNTLTYFYNMFLMFKDTYRFS